MALDDTMDAHFPNDIQFDQVGLLYGRGDEAVEAVRALSFSVGAGESVALIGPSGCGKSTTLHMVAGLLNATEGRVLAGGSEVAAPRRATAFIPQDLGLFPWKTVYQNAALGLAMRKVPKAEVHERVSAALDEVGLSGFERAFPKELSGGMRQRLALARALAMDADILLMDEPLSAIDALLRESLQDTLLDLWRERGHTQMLVTHSIEEAVFLGQRILVFSDRPGTIVAVVENPDMGSPGHRATSAFHEKCQEVREALAKGDKVPGVLPSSAAGKGDSTPSALSPSRGGERS